MRWVKTKLLAVALALGGCKTAEKKPADRDASAATASRSKGKNGPTWLDDMNGNLPGAGGPIPKADSWNDPRDPNSDVATEVRGLLSGVVLDADGRHAGSVSIQIEPLQGGDAPAPPVPMSIVSDSQGYFLTKGLKPGQTYMLSVRVEVEGRPQIAVQQTRIPNPNVTLRLREDLKAPPGPPVPGSLPPPADLTVPPAAVRPADGSWARARRSAAPLHKVVPSPVPTPSPAARPAKPENTAADPRPNWGPPASIPIPTLPPPVNPITPSPADPGRSQSMGRSQGNFVLADTTGRPWSFNSSWSGRLLLVDFLTTTCGPCKKSIPTLTALQSRYAASGFQVIGVVCDEVPLRERTALAAKYARDFPLNYGLYVEPDHTAGAVRDRFQVEKYPTAVLLDAAGRELWRGHPSLPGEGSRLEVAIRKHLVQ